MFNAERPSIISKDNIYDDQKDVYLNSLLSVLSNFDCHKWLQLYGTLTNNITKLFNNIQNCWQRLARSVICVIPLLMLDICIQTLVTLN